MNNNISIQTTITIKIKDQEFQLNSEEANELLYQLKRAVGDTNASYPHYPTWRPNNPIITPSPSGIPPQIWCSTDTGATNAATSTIKFL